MLLFSCNFYTSNGRRKVTTVDLQYLGEVLRNILLYCFSRSFPILWNHSNWFYIKKTPCADKPSKNFLLLCEKELAAAQFKLTELTVIELVEKLFDLETDFVSKFTFVNSARRLAFENKTPSWKTWKETPFEKTQENQKIGA